MRVTQVIPSTAGLLRGGLEIQAEKTREALADLGVEVEVYTPLTTELGDVVHFIGTYEAYWPIADQARRRGIPYVCSTVFLPNSTGLSLRLTALRKQIQQTFPKGQRRLFRNAARLITLSEAERRNLRTFFQDLPTMVTIPNGVDARFFAATPDPFRAFIGDDRPFVLMTGRFEPRKNQLTLIRAWKDESTPLVLIGEAADRSYFEHCRREAGSSCQILDPIRYESELLPSAYAAAAVYAMPSTMEVLSLSALEAGAAGTPCVLGDGWGAEEHFGEFARVVPPFAQAKLREAIRSCLAAPPDRDQVRAHFRETYTWPAVAAQLKSLFDQVRA